VLRLADGKGGYQTRNIGLADDLEDADGGEILTWFQAVERGRKLARGDVAEASSLLTVAGAVEEYGRDLAARGAGPENVGRIKSTCRLRSPRDRSPSSPRESLAPGGTPCSVTA
jgi:hypothetical protein